VLAGLLAGRGEKLPGALGVGLVGCMGLDVRAKESMYHILAQCTGFGGLQHPSPVQEAMLRSGIGVVGVVGVEKRLKVGCRILLRE
jgi:hypothetical protein